MRFLGFSLTFALFLGKSTVSGLECKQIPDSDIFDGDSFYLPLNATDYVTIPANFDCTYLINAPAINSSLLYGKVILWNLLKGVNDRITVTDSFGVKTVLHSRSDSYLQYEVFPGKPMSIQVTTKSVLMNSEFLINVTYQSVQLGPQRTLKTGGVMNFVDMSTLRGETNGYSDTVTIMATEPMSLSMAVFQFEYPTLYLYNTYVIDGDFLAQHSVHRLLDFTLTAPLVTTSNRITLVSFQQIAYYDTAVVINPVSEAQQFASLTAVASVADGLNRISFSPTDGQKDAVEVLSVETTQITIQSLVFNGPISPSCVAQVVTGPPNNSSQVLLDLTKSQDLMPYTFNLKYFSVIAESCSFSLSVSSPDQ